MAKRTQFDNVVIDTLGNALSNIEVGVYNVGTNTLSTIYTTRTGGTTKTNPFTTTSNGLVSFFTDPGTYEVRLHDLNGTPRISDRTIYHDSVGGDTQGIAGTQVEDSGISAVRIASDAVTNPKVADNAITTNEIADNAADANKTVLGVTYITQSSNYTPTSSYATITGMSTTLSAGTYIVFGKIVLDGTTGSPNLDIQLMHNAIAQESLLGINGVAAEDIFISIGPIAITATGSQTTLLQGRITVGAGTLVAGRLACIRQT
jgi:hypothetical protein